MTSFTVVSMVREDPTLLRRFCLYWLNIGADAVHLYYDGEICPDVLSDLDSVKLVVMNDDFWRAMGEPRRHRLGQRIGQVYGHAYPGLQSEWAVMLDADEVIAGDTEFRDFLDRIPQDVVSVSIPTAEGIFGPGDEHNDPFATTHFRLQIQGRRSKKLVTRLLYPRLHILFHKGLLGHTSGKQVTRTGQGDLCFTSHRAMDGQRTVSVKLRNLSGIDARMWLLHFDALSFDRWKEKWRKRVTRETIANTERPARLRQLDLFERAMRQGEGAMHRMFRGLYVFGAFRFTVLKAAGYGLNVRVFGPDGAEGHNGRLTELN